VFPVRRSEEKQGHRCQRDNGELKDMCRRAFVGLGRLSVAAKHGKQSQERQDDYSSEADAVDLLLTHGATSFALSLLDSLPIMVWYTEASSCQVLYITKYSETAGLVLGDVAIDA
jgi:hypothetical protein